MAKGFSKLLKSPKFIGMLYTLRVMYMLITKQDISNRINKFL